MGGGMYGNRGGHGRRQQDGIKGAAMGQQTFWTQIQLSTGAN
jgi:hypothetical protein